MFVQVPIHQKKNMLLIYILLRCLPPLNCPCFECLFRVLAEIKLRLDNCIMSKSDGRLVGDLDSVVDLEVLTIFSSCPLRAKISFLRCINV